MFYFLKNVRVDANSATISVHFSLDADGCLLFYFLGSLVSTLVDANSSPSMSTLIWTPMVNLFFIFRDQVDANNATVNVHFSLDTNGCFIFLFFWDY